MKDTQVLRSISLENLQMDLILDSLSIFKYKSFLWALH